MNNGRKSKFTEVVSREWCGERVRLFKVDKNWFECLRIGTIALNYLTIYHLRWVLDEWVPNTTYYNL